jgi:hypothetical protein
MAQRENVAEALHPTGMTPGVVVSRFTPLT